MRTRFLKTVFAAAITASMFAAPAAMASKEKPVIGFSIDDLRVQRWTRDRDYFIEAAEKLGATVNVQSANASEQRQIAQIENLIASKVDVIVIVPFNAKVLSNVIAEAKKAGIKVIAYDRLILESDIDAYITFDNVKVGEMQAQGVVSRAPKGNIFLLGGAPTDNNAHLLRKGQMSVLKPYIDKGDIKIIGEQWTPEWNPAKALNIIENALTSANNDIQGIVASNDGTAGGAVQALAAQKLAGKVPVSGQDAELDGVRRVVNGTQAMTVYKPLKLIASEAAKMSVQLVRGEKPAFNDELDNGKGKVPTLLLTPIEISKDNVQVLIDDSFYTKEQIFGK